MKHSNRDQIEKINDQPVSAPVVKQKGSLFNKFKAGCCLVIAAGVVAGGLYLYKFYQDVKAEINVEVDKGVELYDDTKENVEKFNENMEEVNEAIDHGKEFYEDAKELKENIEELK